MVTTKTNVFGLALVAVLAFAFLAMAATAEAGYRGHHQSSSDITVANNNIGIVVNSVDVEAETGDNDANGGRGGNGGRITSGGAYADGYADNTVNSNLTVIDRCGCEGRGDITVRNNNLGFVYNGVDVEAETGDNDADGGDGSRKNKRSHHHRHHGGGNDGGNGGVINTGAATAYGTAANVVNSNVTRVRGGMVYPI